MELPFTKEEIITASGVHPLKVRNIYLYGSRVYGTAKPESDYDIIMIASHLLAHEEKRATVNGVLLNIHIITPDKFTSDLKMPNIMNLECAFAPDWAKLQEKMTLSYKVEIKRLIKNNLAQSYSSWNGGKRKIREYNIDKGIKSIFHSLRMLMFAAQIAEHGKIIDYSVANELYSEITDSDEFEWEYFKEKYLPLKVQLENKLKSLYD
jgi:predicted nucleotidyltransferase